MVTKDIVSFLNYYQILEEPLISYFVVFDGRIETTPTDGHLLLGQLLINIDCTPTEVDIQALLEVNVFRVAHSLNVAIKTKKIQAAARVR